MGAINSLLFQPPALTYENAEKNVIWFFTEQNIKIPAFMIKKQSKVYILFSHGNAEDLGMIYDWCCELAEQLNVNLLAYDYEGYGKVSGVSPSETACYYDIDAAYAYLTLDLQIDPRNIIIMGRSLGTGPSSYLAERLQKENTNVAGLVLQCPLLSVFRVAFNFRFTLPYDLFPTVDRIGALACPIYIIHGTRDEIVPFWNGQDLFLSAPVRFRAKPFWVAGAGHNNIESSFR